MKKKFSYSPLFILFITIITIAIQIIKSQYTINHCKNGKRTVILKNNSNITLSCIDCPEGEYTSFNEKENNFKCDKCPSGTSNYKNDIIINNFLSYDLISKYSFTSFCSIQNDICPKWKQNYFSIKVNYIESLSYKSFFTINQYFMNNGEIIIKYINYNGGIDKVLNIYINGKLSFVDDSNNNILKTIYLDVKKGENIFKFEYLVNEEIKTKYNNDSFLEIYQIIMKNAEISALNCNKYDLIEKLEENILNNCEYDVSKCNINNDYCTSRFYSEKKSDFCIKQLDSFYQEIEYIKIKYANCMESSIPSSDNILCEHCSYGQYSNFLDEEKNKKICDYCQNNTYNSKVQNDEFNCSEICETEDNSNQLIKILYINNFENPSNFNLKIIEINKPIGYIIIKYEKFNKKSDTIFYIEIDSNYTQKLINPNDEEIISNNYSFTIPLTYGNHSLKIKGSNLKLNKIIIEGSTEGGNYKCVDKINLSEEIKCENIEEYYSLLENKCLSCPLGTKIDRNQKCEIYNQFINDLYTFDNYDININLFSNIYELDNQNIKYYFNINPINPLIYMKNYTLNLDSNYSEKEEIEIIGSELKNIKIVKGVNERGIILSFISEKYKSYIYIKCNPYLTEEVQNKIYLKNNIEENYNDEILINYYFVIETNSSCPYCLTSEVNYKDSECMNGIIKENIAIKNNSLCVIKLFNNNETVKLINNSNILLNYNSTDIDELQMLKYFEIDEEIPIKYEKENDKIIISNERERKCKDNDSNKKLLIVILILFFFVILIVLGLGGVAFWKIIDSNKIEKKEINSKEKMNELSIITSKE